jgi:hypothetical protein
VAAAQREEIGVSRFGILAAVLARGSDPRGRLPDSPLLAGFDADRKLETCWLAGGENDEGLPKEDRALLAVASLERRAWGGRYPYASVDVAALEVYVIYLGDGQQMADSSGMNHLAILRSSFESIHRRMKISAHRPRPRRGKRLPESAQAFSRLTHTKSTLARALRPQNTLT